jgi:uncharacterized protein with LGFP repeats
MTLLMGRRHTTTDTPLAPVDLADDGIHRDPANHDPIATGTFTQRLANKASAVLGGKTSRRSFLTRTAVLGSALAVGPIDFILKPGSAYGYLCGTCSDGWTAFCCTINSGSNSCPPYSFVAGWWKADNAAYCCGAARYILDCNASCPTKCSCRCAGDSCDGRRTCCNQFRYGQCHTEISCYGPVVCRIATCTPPWQYDTSCTTSSATDNRTVDHGAPCISQDCNSAIAQKYAALGGAGGFLGAVTSAEVAVGDGRGRVARYQRGNIYWTTSTAAHEVHGTILAVYVANGGPTGGPGYPISDELPSSEGGRYSAFENGLVIFRPGIGCFAISGQFVTTFNASGGVNGPLGYPRAEVGGVGGVGYFQTFDRGQLWLRGGPGIISAGLLYDKWQAIGGGPAVGYPVANAGGVAGRAFYQDFDRARIYAFSGTNVVAVTGLFYAEHQAKGGPAGSLGLPKADAGAISGVGYYQDFDNGRIWVFGGNRVFTVSGLFAQKYGATGGPAGPLGYPTAEAIISPEGKSFSQAFQHGRIHVLSGTQLFALTGPIEDRYVALGGPTGILGLPASDPTPVGDGRGTMGYFSNGRIYATATSGAWEIQHPILFAWVNTYGGPTGSLGYPTGSLVSDNAGGRTQTFEHGTLRQDKNGTVTQLP